MKPIAFDFDTEITIDGEPVEVTVKAVELPAEPEVGFAGDIELTVTAQTQFGPVDYTNGLTDDERERLMVTAGDKLRERRERLESERLANL